MRYIVRPGNPQEFAGVQGVVRYCASFYNEQGELL